MLHIPVIPGEWLEQEVEVGKFCKQALFSSYPTSTSSVYHHFILLFFLGVFEDCVWIFVQKVYLQLSTDLLVARGRERCNSAPL